MRISDAVACASASGRLIWFIQFIYGLPGSHCWLFAPGCQFIPMESEKVSKLEREIADLMVLLKVKEQELSEIVGSTTRRLLLCSVVLLFLKKMQLPDSKRYLLYIPDINICRIYHR